MVTEPPVPALIVMLPPGPHVISIVPVALWLAGGAGSQVIFTVPAVWSIAMPIFASLVSRANADFIAGPGLSGGGSSSSKTSRLPAADDEAAAYHRRHRAAALHRRASPGRTRCSR